MSGDVLPCLMLVMRAAPNIPHRRFRNEDDHDHDCAEV
jgi:hypothetical protein